MTKSIRRQKAETAAIREFKSRTAGCGLTTARSRQAYKLIRAADDPMTVAKAEAKRWKKAAIEHGKLPAKGTLSPYRLPANSHPVYEIGSGTSFWANIGRLPGHWEKEDAKAGTFIWVEALDANGERKPEEQPKYVYSGGYFVLREKLKGPRISGDPGGEWVRAEEGWIWLPNEIGNEPRPVREAASHTNDPKPTDRLPITQVPNATPAPGSAEALDLSDIPDFLDRRGTLLRAAAE